MRRGLAIACILAASLALAAGAQATHREGHANDNAGHENSNAGGNGGGGSSEPAPPPPAPEPEPQPAAPPPSEPASATDTSQGEAGGQGNGNDATNANAHQGNANAAGTVAQTGENANAQGMNPNAAPAASEERPAENNGTGPAQDKEKGEGKKDKDERDADKAARDAEREADKAAREAEKEAREAERAEERAGGREEAPGMDVRAQTPAGPFDGGFSTAAIETPAEPLQESSVEEAPEPAVRVVSENRTLDVAQGEVIVSGENVQNETSAFVVLIHPNGTEEVLVDGASEAPWNTTAYENGYYTVEVRERSSSGEVMTVAATRVLVENPRAEIVAAVAAVATSAAVSAGAGVLATRSFDLLGMLKMAGGEAATEAATQKAEDKLRVKTASVAVVRWRARSTLLLLVAAGLLAFFKVFAAREDILLTLPIAFLAAFCYTVGDYAAEWSLARASGAQTQFKIWTPGALSLAVSSVLFRSPFGYPGYVSETDVGSRGEGDRLRTRAGLRALAFMGAGVALTLPFLFLGRVWRWEIAEYGVSVALMMSAAGAMPFSPMPGRDVWKWSKLAWLAGFGLLAALYVLWQIASLPAWALVGVALVGAAGFVVALRMLSTRPAA